MTVTATRDAALRTAPLVAADYELLPIPVGVVVLGLVADPASAAARSLDAGQSIDHQALLGLIQEDLLDAELVGLDVRSYSLRARQR